MTDKEIMRRYNERKTPFSRLEEIRPIESNRFPLNLEERELSDYNHFFISPQFVFSNESATKIIARARAHELSQRVLSGISALQRERAKAALEAARAYVQYQRAEQVVRTYDQAIADLEAQITGKIEGKKNDPLFFYSLGNLRE